VTAKIRRLAARLARAWSAARTFAYHARRVATGRTALHLIDRAGNTRLVIDTRRRT
jgi:hypothetical protein